MDAAPRLWFTPIVRERLRARLAGGDATLRAILDIARRDCAEAAEAIRKPDLDKNGQRQTTVDAKRYVIGGAVACLLGGDRGASERACDQWLWQAEGDTPSDLGRATRAVEGAIVHECCAESVDPSRRTALRAALARQADRLREVRRGNPHQIGNNWWAVTHSGLACAAMAVHGRDRGDGTVYDLAEDIAFALGRLSAFCHHFGDAGLYHEGLGYQGYTCALLLSAILAARGFDGTDLLARFPNLRRMPASYLALAVARPPLDDTTGALSETGWGAAPNWNDSGLGNPGGAMVGQLLGIAPEADRGALRWGFDRLHGVACPRADFTAGAYFGLFFPALHYPEAPAVPPAGILPTVVCDARQGLMIARSSWRGDADDAVLGVYARATHVGGHSHDDAGSLRLLALGEDWILGGGQARGEARYQSVALPVTGEKRRAECGHVTWWQADAAGAVAGMDLRKVSGCYHERYAAVRWLAGGGVDLALMDQIDEHRDLPWDWHLSLSPRQALDLHADRGGFTLRAPGGEVMHARFTAAVPEALVVEAMPGSSRTYSGGGTVAYPGRPVLRARFANRKPLCILLAATIRRGPPADIEVLDGVGLRCGGAEWRRPFGVCVPSGFVPGVSRGPCQGR